MKGIMFNTKYGLEQAVLNETKTRTWRADKKPRYEVGEVVAIKQSYKTLLAEDNTLHCVRVGIIKKGTICIKFITGAGYNNKMFVKNELMPHQIKITKVTPCKLQDITEEECIAEGIYEFLENMFNFDSSDLPWYDCAKEAFASLINKLNGKGYWESNPSGYAYEFELVK